MLYYGTVESITKLEDVDNEISKCEVTFDSLSTYVIFGDYNELLCYIGKPVEYSIRKDVVNGIITEVINTVALRSIVQSVSDDEVDVDFIELPSIIPDNSKTFSVVTFDSDNLKNGDVSKSEVVLVYDYTCGKSKVAKWRDFKCLDKYSKSFNLRLFTNSDDIDSFCKNVVGKYMMVDIKSTNYGLQVLDGTEVSVYEHEIQVPPEVSLASFRLKSLISGDEELKGYITKYNMLESLEVIMYFEPGYHLVEMFAEIILINSACRIFEGYDKKTLTRMVFASRGYLLGSNTKMSNPLVNYHRVITSTLKDDFKLIRMLDITGGIEEGDRDKSIYLDIRRFVTSIMKERRGISAEKEINSSINAINGVYGGLFKRGFDLD